MTEPSHLAPRLIWHPLLEQWMIHAPGRMNRREGADECAFCTDVRQGKVAPEAGAWARPNDFPPLVPPLGEAYIIIYSRDHEQTFVALSDEQVREVVRVWQRLYTDLAARYACVLIFENSGAEIGQTQRHPHGQAYAVSQFPDLLARELAAAEREARAGQGCVFCTILARELEEAAAQENGHGDAVTQMDTPTTAEQRLPQGNRLVVRSEHWVGFIPPYARYPYEVHLYPRRHLPDLAALRDKERDELGPLLLKIVRGYNILQGGRLAPIPYMLGLHQLAREQFHLHLELLPTRRAPGKLKFPASAETAFGLWSNESLPEERAAELRAALAVLDTMPSTSPDQSLS
jgi:UDPglucose--hexose-1-phosphate uridylyltransferase